MARPPLPPRDPPPSTDPNAGRCPTCHQLACNGNHVPRGPAGGD